MGPNFSGHPAGMGHPGVTGHPMGPGGMPHNQGQQGGPGGGMPHQFGGPMVSAQGAQHLHPTAQQQMIQQQLQQQHFAGNPQAMAAMRQQQLLQQRQLMAQQVAFQANMHGGMPINMAQFSQLNPQQLQNLRGRLGPVSCRQPPAIVLSANKLGTTSSGPSDHGAAACSPTTSTSAAAATAAAATGGTCSANASWA
jgi:hypothetical protein